MVSYEKFAFRNPSGKSHTVVKRDAKSISPSYTRSYGFVMSHGKGSELWDVDGNRYIDFAAGIAVLATGHCHPKVVEAVKNQVDKYLHIGGTDFFCPEPVELAEKLQRIIPIHRAENPDDKLVYYGNSGTESVEAALKLARYATERPHILAFYGGFHGRSMGSLSVTASKPIQREGYPNIPGGVTHIPYPARNVCDDTNEGNAQSWCDAVGFIENIVFKHKINPEEVAAVIVEPVQGEGGYLVPRDDFLPRLREMCDKYGILMIADEIQSGMGRTGKWCAMEHWDVKPDIVCLAKGLGSGLPIGAIVSHKDVMQKWVPGAHASTFGGNPVSCVAANATIDIIEDEFILKSVTELGDYAQNRLKKFRKHHPSLGRIDGLGFMVGMDFINKDGKAIPIFRDKIVDECYLNGLITLGCGKSGIRFAPPLILTRELLDEGLDILEHSIARMEEEVWETF